MEKREPDGNNNFLDQKDLEKLADAWQIWAQQESSPTRRIARARFHLFFLLARYGGMRAAEISSINPALQIDRQTGLLELTDRRLFLPPIALRYMRNILTLPEAAQDRFLQMDSGLLRRTFYNIAHLASLPPAACAPRSLRYSRALELLNMHIPPQQVAKMLGMRNLQKLDSLLKWQSTNIKYSHSLIENTFSAIIQRIEIGPQCARVLFELSGNIRMHCLCSLEWILEVEPIAGQLARFYIPEYAIFPFPPSIYGVNQFEGKIITLDADALEIRLKLFLNNSIYLHARLDASIVSCSSLKTGEKISVFIPAYMIKMQSIT